MAKFCTNCGKELNETSEFCSSCGASINGGVKAARKITGAPMLVKREVVVAIILSILTCGIYAWYWLVVMTDDANKVSGSTEPSGGMALLLTIVTCGIYGWYWCYKMGEKLYLAGEQSGKNIPNNAVVYLLLSLFGLSIVSYALIQNDLNKFAE